MAEEEEEEEEEDELRGQSKASRKSSKTKHVEDSGGYKTTEEMEREMEEESVDELNFVAQTLVDIKAFYSKYARRAANSEDEQTEAQQLADIIGNFRITAEVEVEERNIHWTDSGSFDVFMSVNIALNTLVIGLETDLQEKNAERGLVWIVFEVYFVLVFVSEICLKTFYFWKRQRRMWFIAECANFANTMIAFMAVVDLCVLFPLGRSGVIEFQGTLRMLSLLRILGLLRLLRIIKNTRALDELRLVVEGVRQCFSTICWVVILVATFLYIMSIVTTKAIGQNDSVYGKYRELSGGWSNEEYFGTIGRSMYSLLQVMTLDGWSSSIARHVINQQPYMMMFFLIFLLLSTNGLLNVVVAVIVERTLAIAESNEARMKSRENRSKKMEIGALAEIFDLADMDESRFLEVDEFEVAATNKEVRERFKQQGITVEDAKYLFSSIEESTRGLTRQEFINGMTKLKGSATSKDLLEVQAQADKLGCEMDALGTAIEQGEKNMKQLDEVTERINRRFGSAVVGARRTIAHRKGGSEPVVPAKRPRPGMQEQLDLSNGNRPMLPSFPNLLS